MPLDSLFLYATSAQGMAKKGRLASIGSFRYRKDMPPQREANWIDGLRGIAALMVAVSHLLTAFKPELHNPATGPDGNVLWLQLPILRLCMAGPTALALFFIISGYVCSYKILVQNRKDPEIALKSLSRATLGRPARLILPAATATLFSWILAEAGAYTMTGKIDAEWIRNGRKYPDESIFKAFVRLVTACIKTWTEGWDEYDGTQWPMVLLLESSILCYITLLGTAYVTPRMRRFLFVVVYVYGWMGGQALKTCNTLFGMLLAELHCTFGSSHFTRIPAPVPILMMVCGMYLGSFPQNHPEWAPWSNHLHRLLVGIIPTETSHPNELPIEKLSAVDLRRYWHSLGACIFMLGAAGSTTTQRLLSTEVFNFLGRVSLPVYLIHNQLLKTVYTWLVYLPGTPDQANAKTGFLQPASNARFIVATPLFFTMLYVLAYLWTVHVEPVCDRITKRFLDAILIQ